MNPESTLTNDTFNAVNPLLTHGDPSLNQAFVTPGSLLSRLLVFAFPLAGLLLFVILVWAGAEILFGATDKKSLDLGKQRATAAIVGFLLLFASYFLAQLLEIVLGIRILQ